MRYNSDCQEERTRLTANPMPGQDVPECEKDGTYSKKQCSGSTGECWCVEPESNVEIDGSRVSVGEEIDCTLTGGNLYLPLLVSFFLLQRVSAKWPSMPARRQLVSTCRSARRMVHTRRSSAMVDYTCRFPKQTKVPFHRQHRRVLVCNRREP